MTSVLGEREREETEEGNPEGLPQNKATGCSGIVRMHPGWLGVVPDKRALLYPKNFHVLSPLMASHAIVLSFDPWNSEPAGSLRKVTVTCGK